MTDSQSSFSEVPALLEERQRYETWLSALAARRESTPQHVFERVQADYRARLERVNDRISSHRHAIEDERGKLQVKCSALLADEGLRRDERAELELRAHVGELAGGEAETAFGTVDHAIGTLVEERRGLESRIGELRGLLGEPAKPEPSTAVGPAHPRLRRPRPRSRQRTGRGPTRGFQPRRMCQSRSRRRSSLRLRQRPYQPRRPRSRIVQRRSFRPLVPVVAPLQPKGLVRGVAARRSTNWRS